MERDIKWLFLRKIVRKIDKTRAFAGGFSVKERFGKNRKSKRMRQNAGVSSCFLCADVSLHAADARLCGGEVFF